MQGNVARRANFLGDTLGELTRLLEHGLNTILIGIPPMGVHLSQSWRCFATTARASGLAKAVRKPA